MAQRGPEGRTGGLVELRHGARRRELAADRARYADRLLGSCCLCQWHCGVDRTHVATGKCGCDAASYAYFEGVLWGEETLVTPSYSVFFAGCNSRCAFCYAADRNRQPSAHTPVDVRAVAARIRRAAPPPRSFSLIGGEPTVHLRTSLQLIAAVPAELTIVWNSNFYFSEVTASLLAGIVDVFTADLHFGNDGCAQAIAGLPHYLEVIRRNLCWAQAEGALVVRHLVLPGHFDCCTRPALHWLAAELPAAPVHLLTNYLPPEAGAGALARELSEAEAAAAFELARGLGLRTIE